MSAEAGGEKKQKEEAEVVANGKKGLRRNVSTSGPPRSSINIVQLERQWSQGTDLLGYECFSNLQDSAPIATVQQQQQQQQQKQQQQRNLSESSFYQDWADGSINSSSTMSFSTNLIRGPSGSLFPPCISPAQSFAATDDYDVPNNSTNTIAFSALHDEARITNWNRVLELCQTHPETAQFQGQDGWTALHHACNRRCDRIDVMEALVRAHPPALLKLEEKGMTPLHYACRFKAPKESVRLVLHLFPEFGHRAVPIKDQKGRTPLWYAVRYDAPPGVVEMLLEIDASAVLTPDNKGESPLSHAWDTWAEKLDGKRTIQSLTKPTLSPVEIQDRVMKLKKLRQCWEKANRLLQAAYPETLDPFRILHVTSSIKCHSSLFLLAKALYPEQVMERATQTGRTPLHLAASSPSNGETGRLVITTLLEMYPFAACLCDHDGSLPLHLVAANPNKGHWVHDGGRDVLLANPNGIQQPDHQGRLPLHHAAASARLSGDGSGGSVILELLEEYAAAAAVADKNSHLPMHWYVANQTEWGEEAESLHGANESSVRARAGDQRKLPLHFAAANMGNNTAVIEKLVELNPRACTQADASGKLPLHIVCEVGKDWVNGSETIYAANEQAIQTKEDNARCWLPLQIATASSKAPSLLITKLAELYPQAAQDADKDGKRALHLICESGVRGWEDGIRAVFQASPEANFSPDQHGKLPFHHAALQFAETKEEEEETTTSEGEESISKSSPVSGENGASSLSDTAQIEVLFELLRAHPIIIQ